MGAVAGGVGLHVTDELHFANDVFARDDTDERVLTGFVDLRRGRVIVQGDRRLLAGIERAAALDSAD